MLLLLELLLLRMSGAAGVWRLLRRATRPACVHLAALSDHTLAAAVGGAAAGLTRPYRPPATRPPAQQLLVIVVAVSSYHHGCRIAASAATGHLELPTCRLVMLGRKLKFLRIGATRTAATADGCRIWRRRRAECGSAAADGRNGGGRGGGNRKREAGWAASC